MRLIERDYNHIWTCVYTLVYMFVYIYKKKFFLYPSKGMGKNNLALKKY